MSALAAVKARIERKTGWLFGVGRTVPAGSFGRPLFYMRIGHGRDGLVQIEVGNTRRFLYAGKADELFETILETTCNQAVGQRCPMHGLSHWRGPKDAHYFRLLGDEVFGE